MIDDLSSMEVQQEVHELIAQQVPLDQTLDAIARWIRSMLPGAVVAFMSYDSRRCTLSLHPSQRFSRSYTERLQDVAVGPDVASFGSAASLRRQVITEDILSDPRWEAFRDAALAEGLRACWSSPILTAKGELLGTFGTYYRHPSFPTESSRRKLRQAAALLALAVLRNRDASHHRALAERFRSLFVNHPDGVYEFDLEGHFQRGNAALSRIIGYPEEALIGRHFHEFIGAGYRALTQAAFDIARRGGSHQYETLSIHRDGHTYHLEVINFPVTLEGRVAGIYGVCRDISTRKHHEAQIAYQATHDLLTGLPNRSVLDERLEQAYRHCLQPSLLVVMHLDLDGFKTINEGLGHHIGNQLLVAVAERIRQRLDAGQTLARLTGDEFGLLLPDLPNREAANSLAEQVTDALSAPFEIEGSPLHISASIGIAESGVDTQHAHELMQRADLAMEEAKQQGRNTWKWYQGDVQRNTRQNVLLRHDLHAALLQGNQFELHYQPIVESLSGRMRGFEALLRWHHPTRGMISPGEFIPLAEQTGQIIRLGRWVLQRACRDAAHLLATGQRMLPVAVNISSLQFRRDGFLEVVQQALAESGLPPELLELEVTESVLLDGAGQAIALIDQLKELGIRVALDDFGTGFSSLSYLRDLPIHKVKLDLAFIQDITTNRSNAAIVQGIITMSHHMDLVVVAEGVETHAQQQDLVHRQCDLLQGYFFSRPIPLDRLNQLPNRLLSAGDTPAN